MFRVIGLYLFLQTILFVDRCFAQPPAAPENVTAKLEGSISPSGALEAKFEVAASGTWAVLYREALAKGAAPLAPHELFGSFVRDRKPISPPASIDTPDHALQVQISLREDDFLLPIDRLRSLNLELVPLLPALTDQPDGSVRLDHAGVFREEIRLTIPADFLLNAEAHSSTERYFARYQSDVTSKDGHIVIVRELLLKQGTIAGPAKPDIESFRKMVQDDQRHAFLLRRARRADINAWIKTVPPERANYYGFRAYQQREYEAARQLCERAIQAHPDDAYAWNNLGRALAALGILDAAVKAYEQQIAINPKDAYVYNNLSLVQERMGLWDAAIANFRKQLDVHPGDANAISNLPRALFHVRRWAEAEQASSKAAQAQPNNTQQKLNAVIARVCQGKVASAREEIDAALGTAPSAPMLNNAAYYLTECGKESELADGYIKKALERLESSAATSRNRNVSAAISLQNTLATYLDTYGWLLFQEGGMERAMAMLEAAAELSPRSEIYAHLAQAAAKAGHDDQAAQYWREATSIEPGLVSQVPSAIAERVASLAPRLVDREWVPVAADGLSEKVQELPADQPFYFFVAASVDGGAQSARELDSEDPVSKRLLPAMSALHFPVIQADQGPLPSVHIVRVLKASDGKVFVERSVGQEAVAIASDLAPGDFPLPVSAAVPPTNITGTIANLRAAGVSAPRMVSNTESSYSEEARRARLTGAVVLRGVVGTDGKTHDLAVIRSLGLGLDEQAIQGVYQWRFQPGLKDSMPVSVQSNFEVRFKLLPDPGRFPWHLTRAEFHSPDGAARPRLEKIAAPKGSGSDGAKATATFDIDEQGAVSNVRIDNASDKDWAHEVSVALSKWKFAPAMKDAKAVAASCTMEFVRDK